MGLETRVKVLRRETGPEHITYLDQYGPYGSGIPPV